MIYNFDEQIDRSGTYSAKYGDPDFYVHYGKEKKFLYSERPNHGSDVIPMWVADMDFPPPPSVINAIKQRLDCPILGYTETPANYFKLIMSWNERRHNWKTLEEWYLSVPSVMPGITAAILALTNEDDKIIVQSPVYSPFMRSVISNGRQVIYNPLIKEDNGLYRMDLDDLKMQIDDKTKMIILCNPHNPVGRVWSHKELTELVALCLEKSIFIISDEIHSDLIMPGHKHQPVAALSPQAANITVTCVAPNKTFNLAGLPSASLIISNDVIRSRVVKTVQSLFMDSIHPLNTAAMMAAYQHGEEWLDQLRTYLYGNYEFLKQFIADHQWPLSVGPLQGTYLAWLDCRAMDMDHDALMRFFLEKAKVWFNDGSPFGPGGHGYMRLNLACPRPVLKKALEQINEALSSHSFQT